MEYLIDIQTGQLIEAHTGIKKPRAKVGRVNMCKALDDMLLEQKNKGLYDGLVAMVQVTKAMYDSFEQVAAAIKNTTTYADVSEAQIKEIYQKI